MEQENSFCAGCWLLCIPAVPLPQACLTSVFSLGLSASWPSFSCWDSRFLGWSWAWISLATSSCADQQHLWFLCFLLPGTRERTPSLSGMRGGGDEGSFQLSLSPGFREHPNTTWSLGLSQACKWCTRPLSGVEDSGCFPDWHQSCLGHVISYTTGMAIKTRSD